MFLLRRFQTLSSMLSTKPFHEVPEWFVSFSALWGIYKINRPTLRESLDAHSEPRAPENSDLGQFSDLKSVTNCVTSAATGTRRIRWRPRCSWLAEEMAGAGEAAARRDIGKRRERITVRARETGPVSGHRDRWYYPAPSQTTGTATPRYRSEDCRRRQRCRHPCPPLWSR